MVRKIRDPKSMKLAQSIFEAYQPETVEDMQEALKDIFGPMFEAMLQGEMNHHLGYDSNSKERKEHENRRNGYGKKKVKTSFGEVDVHVPRDRDASFEPGIIPKRKRDVSDIENKVLAIYARGMSQRDISSTIEDIYGFSVSHDISHKLSYSVVSFIWCVIHFATCQVKITRNSVKI